MATKTVTAGVDLGGTKIQTVAVHGENVVGSARVLTPQTGSPADVIEAIVGTVRASLQAAAVAEADLGGVGIGTPGEIDVEAGAVLLAANVPGFSDRVELGPLVSKALDGVKVAVNNDVRVGVLGEYRRGAGRPFTNLLGVWVGTGVGGGLILDGELHDGRGAAGESATPSRSPEACAARADGAAASRPTRGGPAWSAGHDGSSNVATRRASSTS